MVIACNLTPVLCQHVRFTKGLASPQWHSVHYNVSKSYWPFSIVDKICLRTQTFWHSNPRRKCRLNHFASHMVDLPAIFGGKGSKQQAPKLVFDNFSFQSKSYNVAPSTFDYDFAAFGIVQRNFWFKRNTHSDRMNLDTERKREKERESVRETTSKSLSSNYSFCRSNDQNNHFFRSQKNDRKYCVGESLIGPRGCHRKIICSGNFYQRHTISQHFQFFNVINFQYV